jgi:hypothetical protein
MRKCKQGIAIVHGDDHSCENIVANIQKEKVIHHYFLRFTLALSANCLRNSPSGVMPPRIGFSKAANQAYHIIVSNEIIDQILYVANLTSS